MFNQITKSEYKWYIDKRLGWHFLSKTLLYQGREAIMDCKLHWYPKFNKDDVILFVTTKTLFGWFQTSIR